MRKILLFSLIVVLALVANQIPFQPHLCNLKAGMEMPEVSWDKIPSIAISESPALEWTFARC